MNDPSQKMLSEAIDVEDDEGWGTLDELGQFESPLSGILHYDELLADEDLVTRQSDRPE